MITPELGRFLRACIALGLEVKEDALCCSLVGKSCEFSVYKIGTPELTLTDVRSTFHGVTEAGLVVALAEAVGLGLDADE
jgi:hypothetical protein